MHFYVRHDISEWEGNSSAALQCCSSACSVPPAVTSFPAAAARSNFYRIAASIPHF